MSITLPPSYSVKSFLVTEKRGDYVAQSFLPSSFVSELYFAPLITMPSDASCWCCALVLPTRVTSVADR